ncbi:hypothetical protein ABZ707_32215 [Streptomyces sp. NPDC006923]|uniref:hypothetical protein n=1 Tax=Streptomyces sp. NPDC006923 TaxID=3155355 RepID=UPI0033F10AFE
MGTALHCGEHGVIHVPITPWPSLPQANLLMVRRANLFCPGGGPRICVGSIWLLPPAGTAVLTDAHAVFDALHLVLNSARSAPRPLAGQPVDGAFSRESADA